MSRRGVVLLFAWTVLGTVALARPALAQGAPPGYPGPTTTVPGQPTSEEQNGGRVAAGQTVVIESCGFAPGGAEPEIAVDAGPAGAEADLVPEPDRVVSVTWNGEPAGTATVGADGCARVTVSVNERDEAPPCPVADVNGSPHEGRRGRNELVVSGQGANDAPRTVTTSLSISCSNGAGAGGDKAGTGADPTVDGDQGVRVTVSLDDDTLLASVTRSPVARWTALPLLLAVIAGLAISLEQRRRARRASL